MAVLSESRRYLFVMAPRTACGAVGDVLCKQVQGQWFPEADIVDAEGRRLVGRKHATLPKLKHHGLITGEQARRLLKFTTIRNPFDSLVSLYEKKRTVYQPLLEDPDSFVHKAPGFADDMVFVRDHSFSEWIELHYARPARAGESRSLYGGFTRGMDVVMRFERLQDDFAQVLARVGVEPIQVPLHNLTEGRQADYRAYYTRRARATVKKVFAADLARWGYRF